MLALRSCFQQLYPAIVYDVYKGRKPVGYGSDAHMQVVPDALDDPFVVDSTGELTRPGAWWMPTKR